MQLLSGVFSGSLIPILKGKLIKKQTNYGFEKNVYKRPRTTSPQSHKVVLKLLVFPCQANTI